MSLLKMDTPTGIFLNSAKLLRLSIQWKTCEEVLLKVIPDKIFRNGPIKIVEDSLKADHTPSIFLKLSSTNLTQSIVEYVVPFSIKIFLIGNECKTRHDKMDLCCSFFLYSMKLLTFLKCCYWFFGVFIVNFENLKKLVLFAEISQAGKTPNVSFRSQQSTEECLMLVYPPV